MWDLFIQNYAGRCGLSPGGCDRRVVGGLHFVAPLKEFCPADAHVRQKSLKSGADGTRRDPTGPAGAFCQL